MGNAESEVKARVEVQIFNATRPDERTIVEVGPDPVAVFESNNQVNLRALRQEERVGSGRNATKKKVTLVEVSWYGNAYGIQGGTMTINPINLRENQSINIRPWGSRGRIFGIQDSQIRHLLSKKKLPEAT